jgi:hypothetical protein
VNYYNYSKQIPNPKFQITNKPKILIPKPETKSFELWILIIGYCLGFGAWYLGLH